MTWHDNPAPNKIDRVFVSETEDWELHHYVDHYLKTHNYAVTDENRTKVRNAINQYPGRAPVKRDDLTNFLNNHWKK